MEDVGKSREIGGGAEMRDALRLVLGLGCGWVEMRYALRPEKEDGIRVRPR